MRFVDREVELGVLEEVYGSGGLVIVYGRRRMGKTFMLSVFCRGRDALYFVVNYTDPSLALVDLARQYGEQVGLTYTPYFRSFREFYDTLAGSRFRVVVLDEFQRLHGTGGVTELQASWDLNPGWRGKVLVLSGSAVGMMERIGLSPEAPLYGRAARILKVEPFGYRCARVFVDRYSEEDKVRAYAVFGGTPGYLSRVDDGVDLYGNILRLVLSRGAPLREEPLISLSMELRDPSRYVRVLEAVANGCTKLGEIADYVGVKTSDVGKYVGVLVDELGLLERRYPLFERKRGKARYYLADNFFRFWFRFVFPRWGLLEMGAEERVLDVVRREIDSYASLVFEDVALQHFVLLAKEGDVEVTNIGRWWRGEVEFDGIAVDKYSKTAYFIEAKWSSRPVEKRVLYRLMSRAEEYPWRRGERREVYVLYSRSGFTFEPEEDVMLFSLKDMEERFEKARPRVLEV